MLRGYTQRIKDAHEQEETNYNHIKQGKTVVEVLGHNDIELVTEIAWTFDTDDGTMCFVSSQQFIDIAYNNDLDAICDEIKERNNLYYD